MADPEKPLHSDFFSSPYSPIYSTDRKSIGSPELNYVFLIQPIQYILCTSQFVIRLGTELRADTVL